MKYKTFAAAFFRIYDKKIASGQITFAQTGIKKHDFTKLCTDSSFVLPENEIKSLCETMKLNEDERESLLEWIESKE